jgi:hypothetical protein
MKPREEAKGRKYRRRNSAQDDSTIQSSSENEME